MRSCKRFVVLILAASCALWILTGLGSRRGGAQVFQEDGAVVHVAFPVQGSVHIKRRGWTAYSPITLGTFLRLGDSLRPQGNGRMMVVCSSLDIGYVEPGNWGVPCSEEPGPIRLFFGKSRIPSTRGNRPGTFPVIVSPRRTKLLNPHPRLRWTAVSGATSYTATVRGPRLQWSTRTTSNEITYPADAPRLQPGVSYKLIVQTGQRNSSEEGLAELGFRLIDPADAEQLHRAEARIMALGIGKTSREFLLAHLFASYGLYAEAIERLDALPPTVREPAVARLTGDLYLATGLAWHAEEKLLKALELFRARRDLEGQAITGRTLALLYSDVTGNVQEADVRGKEALSLYQRLGDQRAIQEIQQWQKGLR